MKLTRRDLLMLLGGGAVGTMLSPIPWKLLLDSSVWTQNWPWIPRPANGPVTVRYTACALCPAGCGVRARCVGGRPVSLAGLPSDPAGGGTLCAVGLAAHHLAWHPARVRRPLRRSGEGADFAPVDPDVAAVEIGAAMRAHPGAVAILDGRPDRAISAAYRELLAGLPGATYLAPPSVTRSSLYVLRGMGILAWMSRSSAMRFMLIAAAIFAWPIMTALAFIIGLGDTWLDWRTRAQAKAL
jgi:hypothetical protein